MKNKYIATIERATKVCLELVKISGIEARINNIMDFKSYLLFTIKKIEKNAPIKLAAAFFELKVPLNK